MDDLSLRNQKAALGNVRLRHQESQTIILVPAPSSDPNDPLNWCDPPLPAAWQ